MVYKKERLAVANVDFLLIFHASIAYRAKSNDLLLYFSIRQQKNKKNKSSLYVLNVAPIMFLCFGFSVKKKQDSVKKLNESVHYIATHAHATYCKTFPVLQ